MAISHLGNQIVLNPNNSLSAKAAVRVILGLASMVLLVALGFMHIGAWLVFPFAGLELLAIAYAFYHMHAHSADFERITIDEDTVIVEKKDLEKITTTRFQRYWAQVSVRKIVGESQLGGENGLFIKSHGNEVEFGKKYINDEQRQLLAHEIKQKLRNNY